MKAYMLQDPNDNIYEDSQDPQMRIICYGSDRPKYTNIHEHECFSYFEPTSVYAAMPYDEGLRGRSHFHNFAAGSFVICDWAGKLIKIAQVTLSHNFREANLAADWLAKLGHKLTVRTGVRRCQRCMSGGKSGMGYGMVLHLLKALESLLMK
ncbi:hypothetical protein Cgig2_006286 [Carnegiea gigantea]|uniref:RNase H type-1 domain-containing protein n=1 Tax=Carnegiea gigantea TaxID=171969 RepID=A0A9Q1GLI2_9CARY|nr:hypothetical protein Cgig2_006286 [Carnegiea gigantea]